jgi:hypothetical protein
VRGVAASRIPHTSSVRSCPSGVARGVTAGWVTIPFSAIQFSGSAATGGRLVSHPVGGAGFVVSPGVQVKRKCFPLPRGSARPRGSGGGRLPRLGDYGVLGCRGPPKALFTDSLSSTPSPPKRSCPSRGVDATDPWPGSKRFSLRSSKPPLGYEFRPPEAISTRGEGRGTGLRRGRCTEDRTGGTRRSSPSRNGERARRDHVWRDRGRVRPSPASFASCVRSDR